jgi:uncharacterized protein (TIGR02757 family)
MLPALHISNLKEFLDEKYLQYNSPAFIKGDPIAVPHMFTEKADIEVSGFLTAVISWGRREMICKAGMDIVQRMDHKPAEFVMLASDAEIGKLHTFVYRTFNGFDAQVFIYALRSLYKEFGSLEQAFLTSLHNDPSNLAAMISRFKQRFFIVEHLQRSTKHLSDPLKNSAAKRINMFLRWMIRKDNNGVDFGIWQSILPSQLVCPLDLHSARVARKLGLLKRKQDNWKAAIELTKNLSKFDSSDPVKYDFALFGLGWYEKF